MKFDFDTSRELDAFRQQAYRYSRQFRLPSGQYKVRVAFSSGEKVSGGVEALTIEPWDGRQLGLSGIALASEAGKVPELSADLAPSLLEGRKQLIAKSVEVFQSGSTRFRRSEPCWGYVEVYEPLLAGAAGTAIRAEIRVLEGGTGALKESGSLNIADFIRPGNPVVPVLVKVPIASLTAGKYALDIRAWRLPGSEPVVRRAEFRVED